MSVADIQKNMQGKMEQSITALKITAAAANPPPCLLIGCIQSETVLTTTAGAWGVLKV